MNELAMVFDCMDIDTNEVMDGMNTIWNALGFRSGLVGGHGIGVDPYYFIYEDESSTTIVRLSKMVELLMTPWGSTLPIHLSKR